MNDLDIWWPDVLDQHEAEILLVIAEDEAMRHEAAHVARRHGEIPHIRSEGESWERSCRP